MSPDRTSYSLKEVFPINMGEEADFERLFTLYHAPLRYYCEQLTSADEECEDIVSQLFITLWTKQIKFESTEHAQAYLYRSAKNACLNFIRGSKKTVEKKEILSIDSTEISDSYLDIVIKTEVWAELYRAIESLPSQCCKVITMSYLEGMTNQEVADNLGLSLQTVKNHKLRGLTILRDKLPIGSLMLLLHITFLK
nr:RNA polymerase sigma-70 factor [Mucilaginibacter sp. L294]